ncbi:MAG TPA: heavy metal translocating P-type ATPase, partial [Akkermansia sp.]|nr:heavy metal translocating P-type ATPase [Akkermansia sp.]
MGLMRGRAINENFLMSLASLGAMFLGDYSEAVGVMLFYRVGEYLQERAVGSSRRSVSELINLRPEAVHVKKAGAVDDVSLSEVLPGSLIEVRPGERVPLDGMVTGGCSVLDTSAMTGESLPVEAGAGSPVLAGYINGQGVLEVRTERDWRHSALARIQELVEAASGRKSPLEGRLSSFSRIYTPLVIFIAILVFLLYPLVTGGSWADGLFRALVLLVISCPCALVLSIPLGFFAGIGRAARQGILLKGSNYLDALRKVKTVVFDKTGTLTRGVFNVTAIHP